MRNIMPLILIIVSIAVFFFFIDPQYKEVKSLQVEIEENNKTLDLATQLRQKREDLKEKYNSISFDEKNELEKLLPDTVDNVRLIIDINNIAEKYGVVIKDISVSTDEDSENDIKVVESEFTDIVGDSSLSYPDTSKIGIISFSFSVSTQYDVFLELMKALQQTLRIVDIRDVTISRDSEDEVFYSYKITMDTYWLK